MADQKKETKDKVVDEKVAKPDLKEKKRIEEKHEKLNEATEKVYSKENIVDEKYEKRIIYLPTAQKVKHIVTTTYKNGVVKNKLVGLTKGTGSDLKVIINRGMKK